MRPINVSSISQAQDCRVELDNHACQCVVSDACALLTIDWKVPVNVTSYHPGHESVKLRTVTGVIAYDDPRDGTAYYLHFHQALDVKDSPILVCENQCRDIGIRINDEPKHTVPNPTPYHNAIAIPMNDGDETELIIPLRLKGVTHYFNGRRPTQKEYNESDPCTHINMTSDTMVWDPDATHWEQQEDMLLDSNGDIIERPTKRRRMIAAITREVEGTTAPSNFGLALE